MAANCWRRRRGWFSGRTPTGRHGEGGVEALEAREEVEAFDPARGIAGVVHVHQQRVEVACLDGG